MNPSGSLRIGIMGGTFDPLHAGHIACAERACEAYGIDRVLFVPAGNPNFKQDKRIAPAETRLAWCERALKGHDRFEASDIEVRRDGVTYAVDTLRQLREEHSSDVELCFILGADSAATLPRWYGSDELARLATFVVVSRPGRLLDDELKNMLRDAGFKAVFVDGLKVDVSSTEIRALVEAGESVTGLVPEPIRFSVECEPTYFEPVSQGAGEQCERCERCEQCEQCEQFPHFGDNSPDERSDAYYERLFAVCERELRSRVSSRRFAHVLGVADACVRLARTYGFDVRKARLAGLLHDWDKGYDDEGIRFRVRELECAAELDPWVVENMPQVLHAHTASRALARDLPHLPGDVVRAVDRHTTAAHDMGDLDMILYVADAIEDGRTFGRIDELRAAVGCVSLEELFFLTYEYWVLLLFERRKQLHPDTIAIWNSLVAQRATGKETDDR